MARVTRMKCVAGSASVSHCTGAGMLRIGNAKPESCTSGMLKSTVFCTASAAVAEVAEKIKPSESDIET
jgi:hypothetical protein